ncbi:DUF6099 family protein [Kitasatospora sp. NPDC094015]|uniref:DUF6099 family protein n=1 Tax=Kitasatospora sp. NPDC094015 TaxID=3155205 RepID=UPI003319C463
MDALRLIKTARHALAEARTVPDALLEAWQAGLLTEAIGARIAETTGGERAALGQLLGDAGSHAAACLEPPPEADPACADGACTDGACQDGACEGDLCAGDGCAGAARAGGGREAASGWAAWSAGWSGGGRAGRLGELGELEPVLLALGTLLHEVAETLVVLACGAEAESVYWRCIDGVDAGAECKDLVVELLRTVRRESGAPMPEAAELPEAVDALPDEEDLDPVQQPSVAASGRPADDPAPARGGDRRAERAAPILVVPLGPPAGRDYRPDPASAEPSTARACLAARAPEDCRSASSPARSVLIDASSSCICSSRLFGASGAVGAAGVCDAAGASDQGSDMRGPLQLGSAV